MKRTSWHIKADGERIEVSPKNGSDFSLEELQGYVGGYIEIVHLGRGEIMVVNEEGKLHNTPTNLNATALYQFATGDCKDFIAGDVLLTQKNMVK